MNSKLAIDAPEIIASMRQAKLPKLPDARDTVRVIAKAGFDVPDAPAGDVGGCGGGGCMAVAGEN